jgi:hypothetical protein
MTAGRHRIFLLSPAFAGGRRARLLCAEANSSWRFACATGGPPVDQLMSGLYFAASPPMRDVAALHRRLRAFVITARGPGPPEHLAMNGCAAVIPRYCE